MSCCNFIRMPVDKRKLFNQRHLWFYWQLQMNELLGIAYSRMVINTRIVVPNEMIVLSVCFRINFYSLALYKKIKRN